MYAECRFDFNDAEFTCQVCLDEFCGDHWHWKRVNGILLPKSEKYCPQCLPKRTCEGYRVPSHEAEGVIDDLCADCRLRCDADEVSLELVERRVSA